VAALPVEPANRRKIGERWTLFAAEKNLGTLVRAVEEAGGRVLSVQPVRQSLEDYFIKEMATDQGAAAWD
jgi:hypothetical protein